MPPVTLSSSTVKYSGPRHNITNHQTGGDVCGWLAKGGFLTPLLSMEKKGADGPVSSETGIEVDVDWGGMRAMHREAQCICGGRPKTLQAKYKVATKVTII